MAIVSLVGRTIFPGDARGQTLVLDRPISFWGGVSPQTGVIIHPDHPQFGVSITNTILVLPGTIGSSSSSAIMLELCRCGHAPAALVMQTADAILLLGVIVAREMGYQTCPITELNCRTILSDQRVKLVANRAGATLEYENL